MFETYSKPYNKPIIRHFNHSTHHKRHPEPIFGVFICQIYNFNKHTYLLIPPTKNQTEFESQKKPPGTEHIHFCCHTRLERSWQYSMEGYGRWPIWQLCSRKSTWSCTQSWKSGHGLLYNQGGYRDLQPAKRTSSMLTEELTTKTGLSS